MTTKLSVRDYMWLIKAYLLGKVLRKKAYRPQMGEGYSYFHLPQSVSVTRMIKLMSWWDTKPATLQDLQTLLETQPPPVRRSEQVPALSWNDGKWSETSIDNKWPDDYRFISVRRD